MCKNNQTSQYFTATVPELVFFSCAIFKLQSSSISSLPAQQAASRWVTCVILYETPSRGLRLAEEIQE